MGEVIAILVIAVVIRFSLFYIVKAKKSGRKCIGCPNSCNCSSKDKKDCGQNCKCHDK